MPVASTQCRICGYDNPPEARFCGNCGSSLVAKAKPPLPAAITARVSRVAAGEYVGFWIRFAAAIIDTLVVYLASSVLSFILSYFLFPGWYGGLFIVPPFLLLYYWLFTGLKGQTLGKRVLGIKVVNVQGDRPELGVSALREVLGKLVSCIALCIGFLWIIFDGQKQGWHDKIANTYVVYGKIRAVGRR
jgi:uncharacterized RDD family membrane protein YckC